MSTYITAMFLLQLHDIDATACEILFDKLFLWHLELLAIGFATCLLHRERHLRDRKPRHSQKVQ